VGDTADERELQELAREIGEAALGSDLRVAAAESVTTGNIAAALAMGERASEWFAGSVVSYRTATKREVLGVTAADVITRECAEQLAAGVLRVMSAEVAVAVTGVGGPDPEDGHPAGTVFICTGTAERLVVVEHAFDGEPAEIVQQATLEALRQLRSAVR
jgi:nicotinamide-nucleotide amidase